MNQFKIFPSIVFDNIKTSALLEFNEKPLGLILNVKFSLRSTEHSIKKFYDTEVFIKYLKKEKLGENTLYNSIKNIECFKWCLDSWCGVNYTYNHSLNELKFNNKVSLGIDFLFYLPYKNYSKETHQNIKREYFKISNKLHYLKNFSSNRYIIIASK